MPQNHEELLKIVSECNDKVTIKNAFELFALTIEGLEQKTHSFKDVKTKITKNEWNAMINALTISYFSTLYVNSCKKNYKKIPKVTKLVDPIEVSRIDKGGNKDA